MTSTKGWEGNFFEDFTLGQHFEGGPPRTLTSGDVSTYIALTGDRTERFCGPLGLIHPLLTFHTVFGQSVRPISLNAIANLGYAEMVWGADVHVGDTLTSDIEVVGLRERSNREAGIVYVRTTGRDQLGAVVLSYLRWVMVRKRSNHPTPFHANPVVPAHSDVVDPRILQVPAANPPRGLRFHWEDYVIGERIHHHEGVTVQESEHMLFTRLFQNSARIHFDALATMGAPLVYGGVVISHGYARSLNGLEGRLGIAAVNAGTHANPVHAGDTLYAFTEVIDTHDPGTTTACGALRLRLTCVKNHNPAKGTNAPSDIALQLDYWDFVSKR